MKSSPDIPGHAPRRQQAEERREQILDAALQVFSEKGFAGASIRDIAKLIGVTEGLLYHYFPGKEQLLQACWKERGWRAHLEKVLAHAAGKPLSAVLRELVAEFFTSMSNNSPMVRMCAMEMQRNPELAEFHRSRIAESQQLICGLMRSRQEDGEIRADADVEMAAGLLMGSAYSAFLIFGQSGPIESANMASQWSTAGVDVIMHGIAPAQ